MTARPILRGAGAAAVLALSACRPETSPVYVGASGPWHEGFVTGALRGAMLAVEHVNRAGGIRGRPLVLLIRNDSGSGERATDHARDFVADRRVVAVLGPLNSGAALAAARVFDGALPAIAPLAASPDLAGLTPWLFRVVPNDSVFVAALAHRASQLWRRAAVLYDNNSFGRGGAEAFRRHYRGALLSVDPMQSGDTAVGVFVSFFRETGVEVVFIAGVAPSGRVVLAETRRQGFRGAVLGNDSWLALVGDPVAEGAYIAARFSMLDSRPEVAAFTRAFRERYGTEPDNFAAYMYDATRVLARAIEAAGTDRAAVRAWLAGLAERGPHPGVTGPVAFTATGDPVTRRFVLMQVRDGRLALIGESD